MRTVRSIKAIVSRELSGYLGSPVAYVFIGFFLLFAGFFTFMLGNFFERNEASLEVFFLWHPWLYMFLVPALGMRLWSEERRSGTIELLLTMPINQWHAIVGKYLAGSLILAMALVLTCPMVVTVMKLGNPDVGVMISGYIGSLLVAMSFLAISGFTSALTRNQVVSFIVALAVCLLLILAGWPPVTNLFRHGEAVPMLATFLIAYALTWIVLFLVIMAMRQLLGRMTRVTAISLVVSLISAVICILIMWLLTPQIQFGSTPVWVVDLVAAFSVTPHYEQIRVGVIDSRAILYYLSIIVFGLFSTGVILQKRRGE